VGGERSGRRARERACTLQCGGRDRGVGGRDERRRRQRRHAAAPGPGSVGVTFVSGSIGRPALERACCSPSAVIAARTLCHSRGLPHVTLDLRKSSAAQVVGPFVRGYARGETPTRASVQRRLPLRGAAGVRASIAPHGSRPATTHASSSATDARCSLRGCRRPPKDQRLHAPARKPRSTPARHVSFPLGTQTKSDTRAEAVAAGSDAAHRPESQEACFPRRR